MAQDTSNWAVVATVDEPPALIQVFVAWYLHLGATEIFLFFDRPDDPAADMVAAVPGVRVIRCDAAHWARLGRKRPDKHQIRQAQNATDAYRHMQAAWLLHVDADEYLWPERPISESLGRIYPWTQCVVVPVAERVYVDRTPTTIFDGAFRRPFSGKAEDGRDLFGPDFDLSLRGLTGHAIGKSFARAGCRMKLSIHRPQPDGQGELVTEFAKDLELLHFDGLTPLQWVYKLLRKADAVKHHNGMQPSPHRQRQIDALSDDPAAALQLHDRLKCVDQARLQQLAALGLLVKPDFDPASAIAQIFPGADVNMSSRAVDDWLWATKAPLLRGFGLRQGD